MKQYKTAYDKKEHGSQRNEIELMMLEYNYLKIKRLSASENNGTWKNLITRTSCLIFRTIKKL
jgi:hypothetical protein